MAYEFVLMERIEGGVGIVTLNRPTKLNAMSYALRCELDEALSDLENDDAVHCIVVTGAGERAFSAGGDIHEVAAATADEVAERKERRNYFNWHLSNLRKPTIGAINGLAYGGAALLASTLDIRIGCERSSFQFLAASYGMMNSTWTLPLIVGWPRAKELLYTGRKVDADEALRIGLINALVPSQELLNNAVDMARQVSSNSPQVVQTIKGLLDSHVGSTKREMYDAEQMATGKPISPDQFAEGFKVFLDRKANSA